MLGARLQRPDRQPLGNIDQVQNELSSVFLGMRFTKVDGPTQRQIEIDKLMRGWKSQLLSIFLSKTRYPFWEGHFEGDKFIAVFRLGPEQKVRSVQVELYGRGTLAATPFFDALAARTGWRIKY